MTFEYQYRRASGSLWDGAQKALDDFNARYTEAQDLFKGSGPDDPDAADALLNKFAFRRDGTAPSFPDTPFYEWMTNAFNVGDTHDIDAFRPDGPLVMSVIEGKLEVDLFLRALDQYRDALEALVRKAAPEHFSYQGFKIHNPDRLGEPKCRDLFEGIDYLVALFKKRGVYPLLKTGVRGIEFLAKPSMEKLNATALGLYYWNTKTIVISSHVIGYGEGRFMKWVNEAFLHEFGHFVHLNYLPREAKEAWDAGWVEVNQKQEELSTLSKITAVERARFFDALVFTKFDPSKASKRLKPIERLKFGAWLRSPMTGDPLITPKQFRWTGPGVNLATFYTDRESFMKKNYDWIEVGSDEYNKQIERKDKQFKDKLGLDWDQPLSIPAATVRELLDADPSLKKSVADALNKLEIVSDYGRTNEKEDFAETFVAFMGAPAKLTPTAKFRMQRVLSLANFYNKPVMRLAENDSLAHQVVNRYLHARNQ